MAAALAAVKAANERSERRIAEGEEMMRSAFDAIDKDGSGELDLNEMLDALTRMNHYDPTSSERAASVAEWVRQKAGADGIFDFDEFKALVAELTQAAVDQADPGASETSPTSAQRVAWLPFNQQVAELYGRQSCQIGVALVILFNFIAIVAQKEIDPYEEDLQVYSATWITIEDVCNWIFLLELIINIYGNFWRPFVCDPWNYLDTTVVLLGVFSIFRIDLGPLKMLKILRAFRILRLFKKIESLNKILVALLRSLPGVGNAFAVMLIFMAIMAVIATEAFRDFGNSGQYETVQRFGKGEATWGEGVGLLNTSDPTARSFSASSNTAMTLRGFHFGEEYFGTFSRSLFTLFQVLTGESWSEVVVRPLLFGFDSSSSVLVGFFFIFYILVAAIILQNVVVTVLLDKFLSSDSDDADQAEANASTASMMAGLVGIQAGGGGAPGKALSAEEVSLMRTQAASMLAELEAEAETCNLIMQRLHVDLQAKAK